MNDRKEVALYTNRAISSEEALLREGANTYQLALAAVGEFQRLVWRRCREVVESERAEIVKAFGFLSGVFEEYRDPAGPAAANGAYAALGLKGEFRDGYRHFFSLWWENEKLYAAVWTEFKDRERAKRAIRSLEGMNLGEIVGISNGCEVWMRLEVAPEAAGNLFVVLRECIGKWCGAWRQVPGGPVR